MKVKKVLFVFIIMLFGMTLFGLKKVDADSVPSYILCDYCQRYNNPSIFSVKVKDVVTKKATCTQNGSRTVLYKCNNCGAVQGKIYTINATGHKTRFIAKYAPKCASNGYTVYECQTCNARIVSDTTQALGHDWDYFSQEADCRQNGYNKRTCKRCGREEILSQTNAKKHDFVDGVCRMCGDTIENAITPPSLSNPNETSNSIPINNTYENYHVHTMASATCESPRTCTTCGYTEGSALGHSFDSSGDCTRENCCAHDDAAQTQWNLSTNSGTVKATLSSSGVLTITGSGTVIDYKQNKANRCPWTLRGRDRIKEVVIDADITTIPMYFFYYCSNLKKVTIKHPDSITRIGGGAFFGCSSLEEINIPTKEMKAIGPRAFCHCHSLKKIDLSNCLNLVRIGHEAFRDCWSLRTVLLPESKLKVIGYEAFLNDIALRDVVLPRSIVAFGTPGVSNDEVGTGYDYADTYIPEETNTSGRDNVFSINFSREMDYLDELKEYVKVVLVQNNVMGEKDTLKLSSTNGSIQNVDSGKLQEFMGQTKIWYYSGHELIENYIKNFASAGTTSELGYSALKWDLSKNGTGKVIGTLNKDGKLTIKLASGSQDGAVKNFSNRATRKAPWNNLRSRIKTIEVKSGITSLGDYLFYYTAVESVTLPSSLKSIGKGVFFGCTELTSISLPDNLESIGYRAFCHAQKLQSITLPSKIKKLNGETFRDCYKLTTVNAEGNILFIGEREFFNDPKLTTIFQIPYEIEQIGDDAFSVDFSDKSYQTFTSWQSSYNNGKYSTLTIKYFEDCRVMANFVSSTTANNKRNYSKIALKSVTIQNDGFCKEFLDSEDVWGTAGEDIVLNIQYNDNSQTTRELVICENRDKVNIQFDGEEEGYKERYYIPYYSKDIYFTVQLVHDWDNETGICRGCKAKCNHDFDSMETVSTCTKPGEKIKICQTCGYIERTQLSTLGEHTWDDGQVTKEATCTQTGIKTYTCTSCEQTKTESIKALGHDYKNTVVQPTCAQKGYTNHKCSRCNNEYKDTYTNALGHDYKDTVVQPTCTSRGYTNHKCLRCNGETKDTYVATIAHNYQNGICTYCGQEQPQIDVDSSQYDVRTDGKISDIVEKTTAETFLGNIDVSENVQKTIKDQKGNTVSGNKKVGTGMKLIVEETGKQNVEFTIIVTGDTDGDGDIGFFDMIAINKHRLGLQELEDINQEAGDYNNDGRIDFFDMIAINKKRLGL